MTVQAEGLPRLEPPPEGRPWTVLHLVRWSAEYLRAKGVPDPRLDAEHLLADVLGGSRLELYLQHDRPLSRDELGRYRTRLLERARRRPLQYVLGKVPFRDLELRVDGRVLIPRPETEVLAGEVIAWAGERGATESLEALDVGTGSGALALCLAVEGGFGRVVATDVSDDALALARENARNTGAKGVEFRRGSLLDPVRPGERFHVLVSNPPYVSRSEHTKLEAEVRDWEPEGALVAGEEGTELLEELVARAPSVLRPRGLLALEMGEGQADKVAARIRESGAYGEPWLREDLAGIPRIVLAESAVGGS